MFDRISWSDGLHRYALVPSLGEYADAEVLCADRAALVLRRNLERLGAEELFRVVIEGDGEASPWDRLIEQLQRRRWMLVRVPTRSPVVRHDIPTSSLVELGAIDSLASDSPSPPAATDDQDAAPTFVSFTLYDAEGVPVPDWQFRLELPDGTSLTERTDAAGRFSVDPVAVAGGCVLRAL